MRNSIDADNERDFFPRLRVMTNMTTATTQQMNDVCNYLYWALLNDLDIIFADQLTEEDRNRIQITVNDNVFEKYKAQPEEIAFPSYELFNQFSEFIDILGGADWQDMPYFTKYYKANDHTQFPKFIFYSGHAEVLGPLFLALETDIATNRAPGSAVFFEFFEETRIRLMKEVTQQFVRIYYKPKATLDDSDTYTFMIPSVANQRKSDGAIALDDFKKFLEDKILGWDSNQGFNQDIVGHCDQTYTTAIADNLGDGVMSFRTDLYDACAVPQPLF